MKYRLRTLLSFLVLAAAVFCTSPARAYSVLSHEEVVDLAWKDTLVPMLKARYPGITDDEIRRAHAFAYGGSVIQDIGYYPFGSHYFSDLLHYVRPGAFVNALLRDSRTPNEYAFALGALAHFCGDSIGHPYINQVTSDENPTLSHRYGKSVTYAEDPTAHLRTEFGFDVVEVAHGLYSQENYRDFIGFQVSKSLLEQAFRETYGLEMSDIIQHEDLAIQTYRRAVSSLIPEMTRVAFVSYKKQIQQAAPGTTRRKFLYRIDQTEYNKEFGTDYTHVGFRGRLLAFLLRIVPKIGPFKALRLVIPNGQEQDLYLKSVNATVDQFKRYLAQIHAAPAPLPPPDPQDAAAARTAADKLDKDAAKFDKLAEKAKDADDKARKERVAANVEATAAKADAAAARTEAKVAASPPAPDPAAAAQIKPPSTPKLPFVDLDTGKPSTAGEYRLADQTYAHLLDDLVKPSAENPVVLGDHAVSSGHSPSSERSLSSKPSPSSQPSQASLQARTAAPSNSSPKAVDPALAAAIELFFSHPVPRTGPPPSKKDAAREAALARQVKADLLTLRSLESAQPLQARLR